MISPDDVANTREWTLHHIHGVDPFATTPAYAGTCLQTNVADIKYCYIHCGLGYEIHARYCVVVERSLVEGQTIYDICQFKIGRNGIIHGIKTDKIRLDNS